MGQDWRILVDNCQHIVNIISISAFIQSINDDDECVEEHSQRLLHWLV